MKLVAKYSFPHMNNSTKYIKVTSDMPKWVNPKWPTRLLQISANGYNFCSRPDALIEIVAKYRFSSKSISARHMEITSNMSTCTWVNPSWLPRRQIA